MTIRFHITAWAVDANTGEIVVPTVSVSALTTDYRRPSGSAYEGAKAEFEAKVAEAIAAANAKLAAPPHAVPPPPAG